MKKTAQVLLSTALTLTAALFANQAQATPLTFSTSGTIGYGYDDSGIFFGGVANTSLAGLSFIMVTTIDPTSLSYSDTDGSTYNKAAGLNAIPFSETVTINGVTKTFSTVTKYAETNLSIDGQVNGNGNNNEADEYQYGYTADDAFLLGHQSVEGPGSFGLGLSFNQVWSYTPQSSDLQFTQFEIYGSDVNVQFFSEGGAYQEAGNLTNISINSSVPEPSSIALLGAALLGLLAITSFHDSKKLI